MVDLPQVSAPDVPLAGNIVGRLREFYRESERVLNITHKPREQEYRQIALITAIGMALIGLIGFVITMTAFFLRGGRL
jgi:protein transport protein SEC61 subunit gamma-like protein